MPRHAAVLGSPIAHSRSPLLHRAAYAALHLDWTYDAIEITSDDLPGFLSGCSWPTWAGLSLTMPLKSRVLGLLDEVSDIAQQVRAANTVVFTERGTSGHNTDVSGMRRALAEAAERERAPASGIIVGAGATARSAVAALSGMGVTDIRVIARNPEQLADLGHLGSDLGVEIDHVPWSEQADLQADLVISTVPPGVADALSTCVPAHPGVLLDVAYGEGPTVLGRAWSSAGGTVADGLDLLLWQAVDQVRLMTGLEPPVDAMRAALRDERTST